MSTAQAIPAAGRRERRKLEVRRRMLEAAQVLFEERGLQATTVADICDRADVAHKTFFNHFPAKNDLVRAIAEESIEILLDDIARAHHERADTASRLVGFFGSVAERASSAGPMRRELLTEVIHAAQHAADEPANARRLYAAFGAIVRDGVAAGEVTRRHSFETLTETILGSYYALMFNWANLDGYPIAERARAAAVFLADALAPRNDEPRAVKSNAAAASDFAAATARRTKARATTAKSHPTVGKSKATKEKPSGKA
jgi:AcrR family transcriptional regulator